MSEYFPKPYSHEKNIKVKIDLSNYATKEDIKNIKPVDTSSFALKTTRSYQHNQTLSNHFKQHSLQHSTFIALFTYSPPKVF